MAHKSPTVIAYSGFDAVCFLGIIFHSSEFAPELTAWYLAVVQKVLIFGTFSPSVNVGMTLLPNLKKILICKY